MPRSRNIKYAFFTNDQLAEHSPIERLFFIGLWTIADHKGELEWRPKKIKALLLPYDECDVEEIAINLDKSGFIRTYSYEGKMYVNITNFLSHQNPHKNERDKGSDIPGFTEDAAQAVDFKGVAINRDKIESAQDKNDSDPADSCSLIPDSCSLIPDKKTMPSKLDGAAEVISHLNLKTGSNFQHVESNNKFVRARIREGRTVDEIKSVIDYKCLEWPAGHSCRKYLRPSTLFNSEKFNQYFGQLGQPITQDINNGQSQQADKELGAVGRINATIDARARERARIEDLQSGRGHIHQGGTIVEEIQ